jgi:NitT/TauT family transport system substrate-binding protein
MIARRGDRRLRNVTVGRVLALTLSSVIAVSHAPNAQTQLKKVSVLTNYVFLGRHSPFFVGVDKGFYREAGLDVSVSPTTGSAFVAAALEGGKADFGIAEAASVVQAIGRGSSIKAFGVFMDRTTSGLASLTPYPTPASLAGKRIAASLTDSARVILPIVAKRAGMDPSALNWVAADPGVYFSLLLGGRAELVTASIDSDVPALRRIAEPRGKTVHFASFAGWGYDVFGYFLVARRQRLADQPDEVRRFAAATARAVRYALDHPDEAATITARYAPAIGHDTALAQWRESMRSIDTPFVRQHGYGVASRERLQASIDLVGQAFTLQGKVTPDDVYADGFMPR